MEIVAQIIGILATTLNLLSFQCKSSKKVILMQMLSALTYTVHYVFLGVLRGTVYMGAVLNAIGIVRGVVFSNKEKFRAENPVWTVGFVASYLVTYALLFLSFGVAPTAYNFIVEFLPVIGMTIMTVSFRVKEAKIIRRCAVVNAVPWFVYHTLSRSIGGSVGEAITLVSVLLGIVRYDVPHKRKREAEKADVESTPEKE